METQIRTALETLQTGDKVIINGVVDDVHQPKIQVNFFDHGLDQNTSYYDHPIALSIVMDGKDNICFMREKDGNWTVLQTAKGFRLAGGELFSITVGFRLYEDKKGIRFTFNKKKPIDVIVDMKSSQVVEFSGDIESLSTFKIDHSARLPILRDVNLSTGRVVDITFSTSSSGSLNIYFQNHQNFISLWILVDVAEGSISFDSLLANTESSPEKVSKKIYPNNLHVLRVVNEVACVKISLDGEEIKCYRHRVQRPYLEYKQLYVDPGDTIIENIGEGEI
ncbi:unnamed protein product [Bursaphelenchus xylophilus]|uniref:(pine wood nematode) hypothetical protein n=1 Tax=Bursaphelenchus xylophilus TaxID=6326 RepID=A0A1I7RWQ0_BURXY|nr:unnamed protein product [Bursaphelenchus xylophilus]CAG9128560.1 unnamed protein product [Bursaphelenchus xylophilus]